ncbi:MAG TPA: MCE family protein [bacterium]|nr:MCE family protein [bacterium]
MKIKASRNYKELRVGAVVLLALIIILATLFSIGGQRKMFGGKVRYKIYFNSTGGLYMGDPVLLTGVEIGNVSRISFPEEVETQKIVVEISVIEEAAKRIRQDTRARIAAASLVYGKVVELSMGSADEPQIRPGELIRAVDPTDYSAVVDSTNLMVDDIRQLIWKLNQGEGMFSAMLNEPLEIRETLHNLSLSSKRLSHLLGGLERGEGALGVLMKDTTHVREIMESVRKAAGDIEEASLNLKDRKSLAGRIINDEEYGEEVMNDLRDAIKSISSIAAKIDTGQGTLGRLVNDEIMFLALQDVVLGVQSSKLAKWLIQNRRKAGERERGR